MGSGAITMKVWRHVSPGEDGQPIVTVMTEAQIIAEYYPFWCEQMKKVGKADLISEQSCIDDWVVVHWAEEVDAD